MKLPCEKCLLMPCCRNKRWTELLTQCSLINKYIFDVKNKSIKFIEKARNIEKIFQPTTWSTVKKSNLEAVWDYEADEYVSAYVTDDGTLLGWSKRRHWT